MNTRRFILRLIVGLLTFCLGVTLAVLLGHVNPRPNVQFRSYHQDWTPPPQTVYAPESRSTCSHARLRTAELKSKAYTATTPESAESDEFLPPPPPPAPVKPAQPATSRSTR